MSVEVGSAYVTILPSARGFRRNLESELGGELNAAGQAQGKKFGGSLMAGAAVALKGAAAGAGLVAGAALGTSLIKGFNRLSAIEQAEAKLEGLGHSARAISKIMENALASVKGTAFGLDEAATIAASSVAAGVKPGKELQATLRLVADAATIGGTSLADMGLIFNKVGASNKVQGEVINQLNERGIPIVQLLAKELGKTSAEVIDMSQKGEIGFNTFRSALQEGVGGSAIEAGNTTQGAFKNMGAAASRFGATLLESSGLYGLSKRAFNGITTLLDDLGPKVDTFVTSLRTRFQSAFGPGSGAGGVISTWMGLARQVGGVVQTLAGWFTNTLLPAIQQTAGRIRDNLAPVFTQIGETVRADILPALQKIVAKFREWQPGIQEFVGGIAAAVFKFWEFGSAFYGRVLPPVVRFIGMIVRNAVPAMLKMAEFMGLILRTGRSTFATLAPIVGSAIAFMVRAFRDWLSVTLTVFDGILKGAEKSLGWVPGIGDKVRDATQGFADFKAGALAELEALAVGAANAGVAIGSALRNGINAGMKTQAGGDTSRFGYSKTGKGGLAKYDAEGNFIKPKDREGSPASLRAAQASAAKEADSLLADFDFGGGPGAGGSGGTSGAKKAAKNAANTLKSARKALKEALAPGFMASLIGGDAASIKAAARDLITQIRAAFGGKREKQFIADVTAGRDKLIAKTRELAKATRQLSDAESLLQKVRDTAAAVQSNLTGSITNLRHPQEVANWMRERINAVRAFGANIRTLIARGMPQTFLAQIVDAGLDGAPLAAALAASNDVDFAAIKNNATELEGAAGDVGSTWAAHVFGEDITKLAEATGIRMQGVGVAAVDGIVKGLKSREDVLTTAMKDMAKDMVKAVKKALGIKSPSRVMAGEVADPIADGTINQLDSRRSDVAASMRGLVAVPKVSGVNVGAKGAGGSLDSAPPEQIAEAVRSAMLGMSWQIDPQGVARLVEVGNSRLDRRR